MNALKSIVSPRTTPRGAAPQSGPADRTGWLHKRGETNTAFKHRFFVLKGRTLSYYDEEKAGAAKGEVADYGDLKDVSVNCRDCSVSFVVSAREQFFFQQKGFGV